MRDEELIHRFEDCTLPLECFHHEQHARVAFLYLSRYSLIEVLARFPANLKRYAAAHGKNGLYHETITWAYLFLINERLAHAAQGQCWEEFRVANRDLFDAGKPVLRKYYREEVLASAFAREHFVLPEPFDGPKPQLSSA